MTVELRPGVLGVEGRRLPLDVIQRRDAPLVLPFGPTAYGGTGRPGPKLADVLQSVAFGAKRLPNIGSPEYRALVATVRADLDPGTGRGFTMQDVSAAFPADACNALFAKLPKNSQADLLRNQYLANPKTHAWKTLPGVGAAAFERFRDWVAQLVGDALDAVIDVDIAQLRLCGADGGNECARFARRHVDGGELAVLVTLVGTGTEVLADTPDFDHYTPLDQWADTFARTDAFNVEPRQMLIITGTDRAKQLANVVATVHASPEHREDRMLLLLRISLRR